MLKAVLFDLDGTLLQVETAEFIQEYLKEVAAAAATVVEPGLFTRALMASTNVMARNTEPEQTNMAVFWADFYERLGQTVEDVKPLLEDFYARRFNDLSRVVRGPDNNAAQTVSKILALGLRIVLATDPLFPASAIRSRMNWAGVGELPWELVTSYEIMHFCKPHPEYYREIAARIGLAPEQCLMVGNDVAKDIAPAALAGMRTYLVTDAPLNYGLADTPAEGNPAEGGLAKGSLAKGSLAETGPAEARLAEGAGSLSDFVVWLTAIMGD